MTEKKMLAEMLAMLTRIEAALTSVSPILDASAPGYGQIANWAWIDAYVSGTTIWPTACH